MSVGGIDGQNYQNFIDETVGTDAVNQGTTISDEQYDSSISTSDQGTEIFDISATHPTLSPPNPDAMTGTGTGLSFDPTALKPQEITQFLQAFPQFTEFLNSQSIFTEEEIHNFVINTLLENPNSIYSAEALAGTSLAEQMYNILEVTNDPDMRVLWENLRADILMENNPMAKVLIESIKQDYIAQGFDPETAKQRAISDALNALDAELSANGVITPYYGTHPEMAGAISRVLTERLGGTDVSAEFVGQIQNLLAAEAGIMAAMDAMAAVNSGESVENIMNGQFQKLDGAEDIINTAIPIINTLPLPEGDKVAILAFMKSISEALATLKELMAEINLTDAERAGLEYAAKVDSIMVGLRSAINQIREMMKEIQKMREKADKFGKLGKVFDIGGIISMVAVNIAVLASVVAVTTTLLIVLTPISFILVVICPLLLPLIILAGPVLLLAMMTLASPVLVLSVISIALKETGELEKMMDGFFGFAMGIAEAFGLGDLAEDTIAYIGMGLLAAGVILPLVILFVVLPILMIVLLPLVLTFLILLPIILVVSFFTITPLIPLLAMGTVGVLMTPFIIGVVCLAVLPLTLGAAAAFLPDLVFRTDLLGKIAEGIGSKVGMSDDQIVEFEGVLRGFVGSMSLALGLQASERITELSMEEQDEVDKEARYQGDLESDESTAARLAGMAGYGTSVNTWLEQLVIDETSPEAIEEKREAIAQMMELLRKLIQQLQKVMEAIAGGGDAAAITAALTGMKDFIQESIPEYMDPETVENYDLQPYVDSFFENLGREIPNILPSPDAIKEMLKQLQEQEFIEEDKELIRTEDIMG